MFVLSFSSQLIAQNHEKKPRKKIGLALSGGSAKGFAHIGVLQVFKENNIPVDFIAGTSMGAFIGGLYSVGYSIDSLETIVRSIQWNNMYFDAIERTSKFVDQRYKDERFMVELPITNNAIRIPVGVISGQRFFIDLLKYTQPVHSVSNFDDFPIPFRAVATNLSNGSAYVFKNGSLAEAIRASMSLPTIMTPVEIGDTKLIDGGIARNLPAQDVKALGADFVIGVDVGDVLPLGRDVNDLFSVLDQSISFLITRNVAEQYQKCDALIRPKIFGFNPTDFDSLNTFIQLGRNAALEILPELLTEIQNDTTINEKQPIVIPKENDVFTISNIMISGIPDNFIRHVLSTLYIERGSIITLADIELDVSRLLGIGLFKDVRYYLLPDFQSKGYNLVFEMKEETKETFNFSFRFDDTDNAAFAFNVNLRDRFIRSSEINGMLRIGETFEADIFYRKFRLLPPRLSMSLRATGISTPLPTYNGQQKIEENTLNSFRGNVEFSSFRFINSSFVLKLRSEFFTSGVKIGLSQIGKQDNINLISAKYTYDCLNRVYYPENGFIVQIRGQGTTKLLLNDYNFQQINFNYEQAFSLFSRVSLQYSLFGGITINSDLPQHYLYMAGSAWPTMSLADQEHLFYGFPVRSLQSKQMTFSQMAIHTQVGKKKYISLVGNYGLTFAEINTPYEEMNHHYATGIQFGWLTPFGPIQLLYTTSNFDRFAASINIGYRF